MLILGRTLTIFAALGSHQVILAESQLLHDFLKLRVEVGSQVPINLRLDLLV